MVKFHVLLLVILVFAFVTTKAQYRVPDTATITEVGGSDGIYSFVAMMPVPPKEIDKIIKKNLQYPLKAQQEGIQGKVYVKFVVNEDGSISNPKVIRGIGYGCDEEAIRLIGLLPRFTPGSQDGKKVKVYYVKPLVFNLE